MNDGELTVSRGDPRYDRAFKILESYYFHCEPEKFNVELEDDGCGTLTLRYPDISLGVGGSKAEVTAMIADTEKALQDIANEDAAMASSNFFKNHLHVLKMLKKHIMQ